jgi:tetraacyldisaccharide 4'-kinase
MSRAFRFLVSARDALYRHGVFATHRLQHPVISVGNITLGGTGKTPLVVLLAERLRDEGYRPVVLSRGYKRKSRGIVIVSTGQGPTVPWEIAGDEPYLIARRAAGVAVVVGADRYAAGVAAQQRSLGNIFILDDGFQHRRLFRNIDLVTVDPAEWSAGEKLLPSGRWREPKEAIQRADAAIVQATSAMILDLPIPVFPLETLVEGIYKDDAPISRELLRGRSITAFAGIAKPERFFNALEQFGINVDNRVGFRDHHAYTQQDIQQIGGDFQITTEKDALKLASLKTGTLLHLRISAHIPDIDELFTLIKTKLR